MKGNKQTYHFLLKSYEVAKCYLRDIATLIEHFQDLTDSDRNGGARGDNPVLMLSLCYTFSER